MVRSRPRRGGGARLASRIRDLFFGRTSTARLQIDSLDGLRGLAALAVVFAHLDLLRLPFLPYFIQVGWAKPGVYLFFALSAFLLTQILLRAPTLGAPRVWAVYALRRFLRIYPLYAVVLLLTAWTLRRWPGYQTPFLETFELGDVARHLLLQDGQSVFWTIAVEFKYYLLLPFVAMFFAALRGRPRLAAAATLACVAAIHLWLWPAEAHEVNTLSLGPYLPIFLLGSFAAYVSGEIERRGGVASPRARAALEALAVACLLGVLAANGVFWRPFDGTLGPPLLLARAYLLFGVLWSVFLVAQLHGTGGVRRLASSRPLRFVGIVSFGIYLMHPMLIVAARDGLAAPPLLRQLAALALVIGVPSLTYLAIERPFLRLGLRAAGRSGR
jgi:peptidoglycan/LPS O-acetylase OafA/YrhL